MEWIKSIRLVFAALLLAGVLFSCDDDDEVPPAENEEEIITDVKLIFTNMNDASDVVEATAQDPDSEGVQPLIVNSAIALTADATYTLTFEITNELGDEVEDITAEIAGEDDEHQIFFSFTEDAFSNPTGDGNIDTASDPINYNDQDANGNPVGLSTTWTAASTALTAGTFTVRLQHQPDLKTADSGANTGDTDFELTFVLTVQ